jgi:hypothetical protein
MERGPPQAVRVPIVVRQAQMAIRTHEHPAFSR